MRPEVVHKKTFTFIFVEKIKFKKIEIKMEKADRLERMFSKFHASQAGG